MTFFPRHSILAYSRLYLLLVFLGVCGSLLLGWAVLYGVPLLVPSFPAFLEEGGGGGRKTILVLLGGSGIAGCAVYFFVRRWFFLPLAGVQKSLNSGVRLEHGFREESGFGLGKSLQQQINQLHLTHKACQEDANAIRSSQPDAVNRMRVDKLIYSLNKLAKIWPPFSHYRKREWYGKQLLLFLIFLMFFGWLITSTMPHHNQYLKSLSLADRKLVLFTIHQAFAFLEGSSHQHDTHSLLRTALIPLTLKENSVLIPFGGGRFFVKEVLPNGKPALWIFIEKTPGKGLAIALSTLLHQLQEDIYTPLVIIDGLGTFQTSLISSTFSLPDYQQLKPPKQSLSMQYRAGAFFFIQELNHLSSPANNTSLFDRMDSSVIPQKEHRPLGLYVVSVFPIGSLFWGIVSKILVFSLFLLLVFFEMRTLLSFWKRGMEHIRASLKKVLQAQEPSPIPFKPARKIERYIHTLSYRLSGLKKRCDGYEKQNKQQIELIKRNVVKMQDHLKESYDWEFSSVAKGGQSQFLSMMETLQKAFGYILKQNQRLSKILKALKKASKAEQDFLNLQEELLYAREVQASILPKTPPEADNLAIATSMIPAKDLGGDFYDYFFIDKNRFAIVIGDVSGKGIVAALFMAVVRTLLRSIACYKPSCGQCMTHVNKMICDVNEKHFFITIFYGILDLRTGKMTYVNAGHCCPYLLTPNHITPLPGTQGTAVGVITDFSYQEKTVILPKESRLFLFTDGITEAMDSQNHQFGEERLEEFLKNQTASSCQTLLNTLQNALDKFTDKTPAFDDMTSLILQFKGLLP